MPFWGNESTMNLNPLILTNIQGSSYFKGMTCFSRFFMYFFNNCCVISVNLFKLKTYHEVVDEIYYQVKHMEPWERGSRKTSGQTGMCGGASSIDISVFLILFCEKNVLMWFLFEHLFLQVRGVGAGGIVSSAYCLLYKLYTLKLTRKQVNGLMNHTDSPYIRGLGKCCVCCVAQ